jgi:hypothetical protein
MAIIAAPTRAASNPSHYQQARRLASPCKCADGSSSSSRFSCLRGDANPTNSLITHYPQSLALAGRRRAVVEYRSPKGGFLYARLLEYPVRQHSCRVWALGGSVVLADRHSQESNEFALVTADRWQLCDPVCLDWQRLACAPANPAGLSMVECHVACAGFLFVLGKGMSFNRNYICRNCGAIRRHAARYVPDGPSAPSCCGFEMIVLDYEQTVAANRLEPAERTAWLARGGKYEKAHRTRQWRAV